MSLGHYPQESCARRSEEHQAEPPDTDPDPGGGRSEFARDRDRILYSSAFRSLAGKSQVVPSTETGQFHTRLTHSLKVAQLGRRIAERLRRQHMDEVQPEHEGESGSAKTTTAHPIVPPDPDLVEFACLAHDIGHPPFGHAGEQELNAVIDEFVEQVIRHHYGSSSQPDGQNEMQVDGGDPTPPEPASADTPVGLEQRIERAKLLFGGFEGNAQSFRIVTRLANKAYPAGTTADGLNADFFGLDLTYAAMDAVTKYPWPRAQAEQRRKPHATEDKWGGYGDVSDAASDYSVLCRARAKTKGSRPADGGEDAGKSFECQVMDWCDDVTYAVHDVEDFYMAGMLPMAAIFDNTSVLEGLDAKDPGAEHQADMRLPTERSDGQEDNDEEYERRRRLYPETGEWLRFRQKLLNDWREQRNNQCSDDELAAEVKRLNWIRLRLCHEIYGGTGWFADLDTVQARRFSQQRVSALIDYLAGSNLTFSDSPMLHRGELKLSRGDGEAAEHEEAKRREVCDLLKRLVWKYVIESPGLRLQQEGQRKILRDLVRVLVQKPDLLPARYREVAQAEAAASAPAAGQLATESNLPESDPGGVDRQEHPDISFSRECVRSMFEIRAAVDYVASLTEIQALALHKRMLGVETIGFRELS